MRGVLFCLESPGTYVLYDIFQSLDVKRYTWRVEEAEIYDMTENRANPLFSSELYDGRLFEQKIAVPHMMIFGKFTCYLSGENIDMHHTILTYQDFLNSNCKLILLCTDHSCFEYYSRSQSECKQFYQYIKGIGASNVEYITEENDGRTVFTF